jgi:chromosome segregation ATPase
MINKLYNLKKLQTQQQLAQRNQLLSQVDNLNNEIKITENSISKATVQTIGAISDFKILEIHKNTMQNHIVKLNQKKSHLKNEIEKHNKIIIELNKETEQFKYIKQQQEKDILKKQLKKDEDVSAQYIQAKWKVS